jgi:cob(I)alamin adenosyltransferase
MKIYTKTGDTGTTSLVGGTRVSKANLRIDAYGTVDELNAWMGVLGDMPVNQHRKALLKEIQDRLFTIGANLASERPSQRKPIPDLYEEDIALLENAMDEMDAQLPELRFFVLPGGHPDVSFAHVARTVCRRAERLAVQLAEQEEIEQLLIRYLNRLSDFLFVLSRAIAHQHQVEEIKWQPRVSK